MKSKDRKTEETKKEEILLGIPLFVNQLLLLLGGGMVLQEAMQKIHIDYMDISPEKRSTFEKVFAQQISQSLGSGKNIVQAFESFASYVHVKELSRVAKILSDGHKKGIDISARLEEEAGELWEIRKQLALQRIRLAESKMSFPLALILMALIILTAAPAMMQMYID